MTKYLCAFLLCVSFLRCHGYAPWRCTGDSCTSGPGWARCDGERGHVQAECPWR
jgi:hypothetical protein